MKKQLLSEELLRMKRLAGLISESQYAQMLNESVEVPTWLKSRLEDVHSKVGKGSVFSQSIDSVLKTIQDAVEKEQNIDKIANSTGTLTINSPGIGYNLVLPMDKAKNLPGAKLGETEQLEGTSIIKVPSITTSAPLEQFKTNQLTIIVRPKKDKSGAVSPGEYIVLSAFPGDPTIPKASDWGGKYAVIIPGGSENVQENVSGSLLSEEIELNDNNYELPDFEEKKNALNQIFPYGEIDSDHYSYFGYESEKDLENAIEWGEVDSDRIINAVISATQEVFPESQGFKVTSEMYSGDEKCYVTIVKGEDSLQFDLKIGV